MNKEEVSRRQRRIAKAANKVHDELAIQVLKVIQKENSTSSENVTLAFGRADARWRHYCKNHGVTSFDLFSNNMLKTIREIEKQAESMKHHEQIERASDSVSKPAHQEDQSGAGQGQEVAAENHQEGTL